LLDAGYWLLDTGYWLLETGCWMLETGCWMLDTGLRPSFSVVLLDNEILNFEFLMLN